MDQPDAVDAALAAAAASLEREDADGALAHAAAAVRIARRAGDAQAEGRARALYGRTLGWTGRLGRALAQIEQAELLLDGEGRADALLHRSALLYKSGDPHGAIEACARAVALLPDAAHHQRARALNNTGIALMYVGDAGGAQRALSEAERLHRLAGHPVHAAQSTANRAMALARLGDLLGALHGFDAAERELRAHGAFEGQNAVARADVLLDAGLLREVRRDLPPLIDALDASGMRADAAEGRLYLAVALLGLRDPGAPAAAEAATAGFTAAGSPGWAAIARLVEVRARWAAGEASDDALRSARRAVADLRRRGMRPHALEAQLLHGLLADAAGRPADARRSFAEVAEGRHAGTVRHRAIGWEGLARLRLLDGDRRGALRAADAGLRLVERHRRSVGAADLRAGASAHGVDLAALALGVALRGGDATAVLRWAERWRAGALHARPLHPPGDPTAAAMLAELRQLAVEARAAGERAAPDLERRTSRLERALADHTRTAAAAGPAASLGRFDVAALRRALGARTLVEYVECGGRMAAVVLDARRCRLRDLGPVEPVRSSAAAAAFALRKLARLPPGSGAAASAAGQLRARADHLRALLLGPLTPDVGGGELVVVPTGELHAVPWQLLARPGQVVAVAPSAALWQRAAALPLRHTPVVAVAGPGLPGAVEEVELVARRHGSCTTLTGGSATVARVGRVMSGAALLHLAAHGDVRADSPAFSSFRLADGPATVHDLERLSEPPRAVVLSACDSGLSQVDAGDELLGLVAALLAAGTRTAVAAVGPVPDGACAQVMDRFHERWAAGDGPGAALAAATAENDGDDASLVAARAAFVCLGAA